MRRLLAIGLAAAAVLWVRHLGPVTLTGSSALAVGFMLLAAWVVGDFISRLHVPRLTAYLLFGVLIGPYLGNVISVNMADPLRTIAELATTLIALVAGLTLNVERLSHRLGAIARMTGVTVLVTLAGLLALLWFAWPLLPIAPDAVGLQRFAMVALLAIMVVSFSPTMTAAVITESGSRGRLSELVLTMVVLADLALLLLFSLAMQQARAVFGAGSGGDVNALVRFAWEIGGAVAFGALIGALFALYLRYVGREVTLVFIGVCAVLSQIGSTQQFEPLLAAVTAGLVIENLSVAEGDALKVAVARGAPPVLIVLFVAVGTSLRLEAFATAGFVALALAAVRLVLLRLGIRAGLRFSSVDPVVARYAWTGLISQAGITLGLVSLVASEFPDWGGRLQTVVVALIALHELVGPVLFRAGLVRAGELTPNAPRPLIVVSNREPYLHAFDRDRQLTCTHATGGVAVALDALMRERHGVWIAHGAGAADREVVDGADKVRVPPDSPSYDLRRLWLEEPSFSRYYGGFANEGLWPLCHVVDVRPVFRSDDWAAYQDINDRFAAAIDLELGAADAPVFIQDYHLALVAPSLRRRRPAARTALFWHIPWPYPDRLRICPWQREILTGLLANDLLAFQLDRDRRNFLLAAEEELGAEIESEGSRVRFQGRSTTVVTVPIGVDYDRIQALAGGEALAVEQRRLVELFNIDGGVVGIGVDRLDYTKGIPERLAAIDLLLTRRPELRGRFRFVQVGVPSRSALSSYGAIEREIERTIASVNARHMVAGHPAPIHFYKTSLDMQGLVALYRLASFCVVSSLHDGMNLVAKEFVAARDDEDGVLVLSGLAGASQELNDALIINPYDVDGFAKALSEAIDMPLALRQQRMRAMRRVVAGRNVFIWASDILEGLESLWTRPLYYAARASGDTSA